MNYFVVIDFIASNVPGFCVLNQEMSIRNCLEMFKLEVYHLKAAKQRFFVSSLLKSNQHMFKQLLFALAIFTSFNLQAQLFIDTSYTPAQMIHSFFDSSGVTISNLNYSGSPVQLAFFEGSQSNIGLKAGFLMSTGYAVNAVGPNDSPGGTGNLDLPGTQWLSALINGYPTYDASVIEMDVVPKTDTLSFRYVFASEEYKEFVNSNFNDLFAFFVEGPGLPQGDSMWIAADTIIHIDTSVCTICVDTLILNPQIFCFYDSLSMKDTCITWVDTIKLYCYQDPNCVPNTYTTIYPGYWVYSPGGVNIAQVPGTNLPVAINNLNQFVNTQYFVDNAGGASVQYDAFTVPLWANLVVQHGQSYHVRVAIADASDHIYDSGVFLSIQSLGGDSLLHVVPNFSMSVPSGNNTIQFENHSFWGTKYYWNFGDGTYSTEKNPVHTFPQAASYTVSLTVSNWCSSKTYTQQVQSGLTGTTDLALGVFQALPNPTSGVFTLHLIQDSEAAVRIMSLDGRLVLEDTLADGSKVDLNRFGKGIYMLQVVSNGRVYMEKIANQ
jgi:hypothetical protein